MRLTAFVALPVVALLAGGATPQPARLPFDGVWMTCDTYRGVRICTYKALAQRGDRVCGVQSDFATNRAYVQRFVATATGKRARIEKICGDPGSETDTYCTGQSPAKADQVGWGMSDKSLYVCGKWLESRPTGDRFTCTSSVRTGLPKVRSPTGEGPEPADRAWLAGCLNGAEVE